MKNKKFLITNYDYIINKLENWKCEKCGNTEKPQIIEKQDDDGELLEMYIKCKKCNTIIAVSKFD